MLLLRHGAADFCEFGIEEGTQNPSAKESIGEGS